MTEIIPLMLVPSTRLNMLVEAFFRRFRQRPKFSSGEAGRSKLLGVKTAHTIAAAKVVILIIFIALGCFTAVADCQFTPIRIAYATTSGIRLPLWIAEEAKLYEKYGLDAKLINIPSGNTAISALVSGEVDIVSGSGSASIVGAGRGVAGGLVGGLGGTTAKPGAKPRTRDP